ncbi:hypothetical protein [Paenibacillus taichungensis]|uniref:hypothetical protein n=1 Tax=Paenibacillus taichungensis TaxID=484184 RepID=UPI0035DE3294
MSSFPLIVNQEEYIEKSDIRLQYCILYSVTALNQATKIKRAEHQYGRIVSQGLILIGLAAIGII